ncbi:DUF2975 domain-containing protein [Echinicola marina]|uniref:DUF2975 domain-containing protein n=1 Tax=Echinicola marina TaxID=2859768 RepID=UPI001CF69FE9|nr:DUF2975 domain-containing protein [Echinicola marina]UCS95247.1 DUF2975 domain-containing protein [Echinicola marina]
MLYNFKLFSMTALSSNLIKRGPTLFLKGTVILIGIAATGLCGALIYLLLVSDDIGAFKPVILGMILTAIPFFLGLFQAFQLLNYIDSNIAFSDLSVKALKKIKMYSFMISGFYLMAMPYIYYIAERDDAPGGILMGVILVIAPAIIAVFAATLQELLKNAIELKSENDLTV